MKKRRSSSRFRATQRSVKRRKPSLQAKLELLESRQLLAGDVLQNPTNVYDVNNDAFVSPVDALIIRKAMVSSQTGVQAAGEPGESNPVYADVTGDGAVNEFDVHAVIAELNRPAGEPGDVVTFRVDTLDLSGNSITSIDPGTEFDLVVFVSDTRDTPAGIFGAYLDIEYPATLATALSITHGDVYPDGRTGSIATDGLIDEVGAFRSASITTTGETELVRIRMRADSSGPLTISSNVADNSPASDVLLPDSPNAVDPGDILYPTTTLQITGQQGTDDDLVAFAQALAANNVQLWTSTLNARGNAAEQLDLFGTGQHFLPINEVFDFVPTSTGDARFPLTTGATQASVDSTNIWIWPDGSRSDGSVLTLAEIASESGVAIPQSADPSIVPIDDVTVLEGSPLHIPLDGYDPNGDALTYTVTVGDDALLETFIPQNNRSVRIPVSMGGEDIGSMVLQLFEDRADRATDRFIELANEGFHQDVIFHRVIDGFMIQGGDPTGTGAGGSDKGDFDDQFHVDLQHNRPGVLSMAKAGDDTNDSQFFIIEEPTRFLDFNHTVFGQLVEGERVRQTISNVETGGSGEGSTPQDTVVMSAATVFDDQENSLVMLRGLGTTGSTTVTVTATDPAGNSASETFTVTLGSDTSNSEPFLNDIPDLEFEAGADDEFQIEFQDVEGDAALFFAELVGTEDDDGLGDDQVSVSASGVLTASGWVGTREVQLRVASGPINDERFDPFDQQVVSLTLFPTAPTSVDLLAATDSGLSDTDNITNVTELQFEVTGVKDGDTVIVFSGDTEVGRAVASGSTVTITQANTSALGSGEQTMTAVVERNGLRSQSSPAIAVTLDQDAPDAISNTAPDTAVVGTEYTFDAEHDEESSGDIQYSLTNAPTGMTIDSATGEITWTPSGDQAGTQAFDIVVSDIAGNETATSVSVEVEGLGDARIDLEVRDSTGNLVAGVPNGGSFFIDVYVEDLRATATGVSQAFVDIAFDTQGVAAVDTTESIQVGPSFSGSVQTGTVSASGVVNVGGVATTPVLGRTLLATIPMIAQGLGTLQVDVSANTSGVQLDGDTEPLADADMQFEPASLVVVSVGAELTATDDALTIDEDSGEHVIDVLDNDVVPLNSGGVSIISVTGGADGATIAISEDGLSILYTPAPDFPVGSPDAVADTFQYTIEDATSTTATGTVTVTVNPVNDPPVANDDEYPQDFTTDHAEQWAMFLREDSTEAADLWVIHNDNPGPDGENTIFLKSVSSDTGATVELINARLWVSYLPAPNFFGEDTFTYELEDETDNTVTDSATVTVNVAPVNDAPTAADDTINVSAGQTMEFAATTFTGNDSAGPQEDEVQNLSIVDVTQPSQGTVTINTDGSISYTADPNATGTDTFTYTIEDDGMTEDFDSTSGTFVAREDFLRTTATVTVRLNEGNAGPTAVADVFPVVNDGTAITLPVLQNDQDDDVQSLEVISVSETTNGGTVTLTDGVVTYQPATDFVGTDTFTYTVSDGEFTATGQVTVNVLDPNSATNSRFEGTVFFDKNGNGQQDTGESGIAGVRITLSGTDTNGNAVSRSAITNANGVYAFNALPAGTYEVRQTQASLLVDGDDTASGFAGQAGNDTFTIEVGDSVVISEGNTFAERGLSPKYAMLDAISSRRRSSGGFLTAISSQGSEFLHDVKGWDGYSDIEVTMSADRSTVTVRATDPDAESVSATMDARDRSQVALLGRDGDIWLLRILVSAAEANLQADSDS